MHVECMFLRIYIHGGAGRMTFYNSNRDKLLQQLSNVAEDNALLITHPKHVFYFTGFYTNPHERFMGLFWAAEKGWTLILPGLDALAAKSKVEEHITILSYSDEQNPADQVRAWLQDLQVGQIWVEENVLNVERGRWLQQAKPTAELCDLTSVINGIKSRKTHEELNILQEAAHKTDQILRNALQQFTIGMTEYDLVAEIEYQAKKLGAEQMSFGTSVLGKEKSALPHGKASTDKLSNGFMLIDFGIVYRGYTSDMTRTFHIGPWEDEALRIYETVLKAEKEAIKQARIGMTFEELDGIARDMINTAGFGSFFVHRLGHGLGIDVHEYPSISKGNKDTIEEGMVFTIEPGIYVPDFGGVRIEDAVYMTKEGAQALTSFPKEAQDVLIL